MAPDRAGRLTQPAVPLETLITSSGLLNSKTIKAFRGTDVAPLVRLMPSICGAVVSAVKEVVRSKEAQDRIKAVARRIVNRRVALDSLQMCDQLREIPGEQTMLLFPSHPLGSFRYKVPVTLSVTVKSAGKGRRVHRLAELHYEGALMGTPVSVFCGLVCRMVGTVVSVDDPVVNVLWNSGSVDFL